MTSLRRCARCHYPMHTRDMGVGRFHRGRGLCCACHTRVSRAGWLADYERRNRIRDEVMVEWELLRGEGYTKRQAAARLGMTFAAFDRAFHRSRRAGDSRAKPAIGQARLRTRTSSPSAHHNGAGCDPTPAGGNGAAA